MVLAYLRLPGKLNAHIQSSTDFRLKTRKAGWLVRPVDAKPLRELGLGEYPRNFARFDCVRLRCLG